MVKLEKYNKEWPLIFIREKRCILKVAEQWILNIEHVGSTSVPGLTAKPIIDILMGVRSLEDADRFVVKQLQALGYMYISEYEETMPFRRYFIKNTAVIRINLHLVEIDTKFWRDLLLFRDILRVHPDIAIEYSKLKHKLAAVHEDANLYADAKTEFINSVLSQARSEK